MSQTGCSSSYQSSQTQRWRKVFHSVQPPEVTEEGKVVFNNQSNCTLSITACTLATVVAGGVRPSVQFLRTQKQTPGLKDELVGF